MKWHELAFKSLFRRRKKTLILFTAIVISVFIITAFISAYQGMMRAVEEGVNNFGTSYRLILEDTREPISYQGIPILPGGSPPETSELTIEDLEMIRDEQANLIGISPRIVKEAQMLEDQQQLVVVGIDINEERAMKRWWRSWGSWPKSENEILVGYDIGNHYNLRSGDELPLLIDGNEQLFKVTGLLHYTGYIDDRLIFSHYDQPLFEGNIDFIEMVVSFGQKIDVTPAGWEWKGQHGPLREERLESVNKIGELSPYIIAVTTILGILIVLITLLNEVGERRNEFALWQAVGLKKKMIITILLFEITILSFVGSIVGLVLGLVTANVWSGLMSGLQFFAWLSIDQIGFLVLIIMVTTLLISLYPISIALRKEPISLLRHE